MVVLLVYIAGLMKRCMNVYWINGKFDFNLKLTEGDKIDLNKRLIQCNETRPREIQREIRGIKWLSYWKATEFRVTLLYTGIVIFKDILSREVYEHFKKLSLAIRILSCRYHLPNINVAEVLLNDYLEGCINIYGIDSITSSFHAVCHIIEDLKIYNATLVEISTFPFENELRTLKHLVRNGREPLSQIARRISELSHQHTTESDTNKIVLNRIILNTTLLNDDTDKFSEVCVRDEFVLRNDMKNGWFLTKLNEVAYMNYACKNNKKITISASVIKEKGDFFVSPCSSSKLDIYASDGLLENNKYVPIFKDSSEITNLSNIKCKCFMLFYKEKLVFLPLLHTLDAVKTTQ